MFGYEGSTVEFFGRYLEVQHTATIARHAQCPPNVRRAHRSFECLIRHVRAERSAALREEEPQPVKQSTTRPEDVVEGLKHFKDVWHTATPEIQKKILNGLYEKITVNGYEFVSVKLTPEALEMGMALALPEDVKVRRPRRLKRAREDWSTEAPLPYCRSRAPTNGGRRNAPPAFAFYNPDRADRPDVAL